MPSCAGSKLAKLSSSMISVGGVRPSLPITVASGRSVPDRFKVIVGPESWVVERLLVAAPPGTNSPTVPVTWILSPGATVGAAPVKTKMPSEVASSPSPSGSCR